MAILSPDRERDLQKGIDYLAELFQSIRPDWVPIVVSKCKQYGLSFNSEIRINDRPHRYHTVPIWMAEPGLAGFVFAKMLSDGTYSAPALSHRPVRTGDITELVPGPVGPNPVLRLVDDLKMAIYNVTLPPHIFFPGIIRVQVSQESEGVFVTVYGEGRGNLAWFNMAGGFLLFTGIVERLRVYVAASLLMERAGERAGKAISRANDLYLNAPFPNQFP